jgi:hypothetical protein
MYETTTGAIVAAICGITAALILLLPRRTLLRRIGKPAPKPELPKAAPITIEAERLTEERRALTTAWRKEARVRELCLQWTPVLEHETERLARLVVDGITTRGNAIHRVTALVRKHSPVETTDALLARIRQSEVEFVRRISEPQA